MTATVTYAIRAEERNDVKAMAHVRANGARHGFIVDGSRKVVVSRNGGLWQYVIPVLEEVIA